MLWLLWLAIRILEQETATSADGGAGAANCMLVRDPRVAVAEDPEVARSPGGDADTVPRNRGLLNPTTHP